MESVLYKRRAGCATRTGTAKPSATTAVPVVQTVPVLQKPVSPTSGGGLRIQPHAERLQYPTACVKLHFHLDTEAVVQTVPVLKTTTGTGIAGECSLSTYPILSVPVLKNSYRYKPLTKVRSPHMPDSICTGSEISTTGTDRWESSASVQWREISLLPEPSNVHPQCSTAKTSLLFDLLSLGECCLSTCR